MVYMNVFDRNGGENAKETIVRCEGDRAGDFSHYAHSASLSLVPSDRPRDSSANPFSGRVHKTYMARPVLPARKRRVSRFARGFYRISPTVNWTSAFAPTV